MPDFDSRRPDPVQRVLAALSRWMLTVAVAMAGLGMITKEAVWSVPARSNVAAGLLAGTVAVAVGAIDLARIPRGTRESSHGFTRILLNALALVLFALTLARYRMDQPLLTGAAAFWTGVAAVGLGAAAFWLERRPVARPDPEQAEDDELLGAVGRGPGG